MHSSKQKAERCILGAISTRCAESVCRSRRVLNDDDHDHEQRQHHDIDVHDDDHHYRDDDDLDHQSIGLKKRFAAI